MNTRRLATRPGLWIVAALVAAHGASLVIAVACTSRSARADSLWDRRAPRTTYLFADNRARRVGDLLTIVVRETTDIDHRDKRQMNKNTATGGIFKFKGSAVDTVTSRAASADLDSSTSSQRTFDSKAEFSSAQQFTDRMTVVVIDVLPNGNLLIEGKRRRNVSGEDRAMCVSGLVRPDDIGPGNMVQSERVANFQITYDGRGQESAYTNNGWLGRIMNHYWPF